MRRTLALAFVAALMLTACSTDETTPTAVPDLEVLRVQYGLPKCPETDLAAEQVPGGLPTTALPCLGTDQSVNLAGLPREPMVMNFWAQWCAPCRLESLFLAEAFEARDDVAFVGINYQDPQPDWAIEYAGLVGWNYPHIQDMERSLQASAKVPGLPFTLFVDAEGQIVGRHLGGIESTEQLLELIDQYLGVE